MIFNVNPHFQAFKDTRQTLKFAQRAKTIKTQAVINEEKSENYWREECKKYQHMLQRA